jgi:hypothetical protein
MMSVEPTKSACLSYIPSLKKGKNKNGVNSSATYEKVNKIAIQSNEPSHRPRSLSLDPSPLLKGKMHDTSPSTSQEKKTAYVAALTLPPTPPDPTPSEFSPREIRRTLQRTYSSTSMNGDKSKSDATSVLPSTTPIFDKKTWAQSEHILSWLERYAKNAFSKDWKNPKVIVSKFIKEELLSALEIPKKIKRALPDFRALIDFIDIVDVQKFCRKAQTLHKNDLETLQWVIGGINVLPCLNISQKPSTLKAWEAHVEKLTKLQVTASQMGEIRCPDHFDDAHPISNIKQEDILSSFRYMYAEDFQESEKIFFINNQWLPSPVWSDQKELKEEIDRKKYFIDWLIKNLNEALGISNEFTSKNVELLFEEELSTENKSLLNQELDLCFKKCSSGENTITFENCQRFLNESSLAVLTPTARDVLTWLRSNYTKLYAKQTTLTLAEIISLFAHERWLNKCSIQIPCFRILQALSFSAYAYAHTILQQRLCPALMHRNHHIYRMQYFPTEVTRRKITVTPHKTFVVTHEKPYRFVKGDNSKFEEAGGVTACWSLMGSTNSPLFQAAIWCENLELKGSIDTRLEIIKGLGL